MQKKLFDIIKKTNSQPIVINADDLSSKPKEILKLLCKKIKIEFDDKM